MMNNICQEYDFSMESLLLCYNKPPHSCSKDTHKTRRMDKRKFFVFPIDSIEISSLEGFMLWCSEINQSKRPLAW